MSDDMNPDNLPAFSMPESMIKQIYEFTGCGEEDKGFVLFFVDQNGCPQVLSSCSSPIIEMGLLKSAEEYLDQISDANKTDPGELE
tara:strand:- start:621 stop:878 length:258 start_codon:yes stop_codon:yes gene_type:complete